MSAFDEASKLKVMLTRLVNEVIDGHPIVKRTLKAEKCVIVSAPNQQTHTIKVRLTPFDKSVIELPYAPKIPLSELQPNKVASVWYFYSVNNGIVMQNHMWTAYGQDDLENLASGELNLVESVQILAKAMQQLNTQLQDEVLNGYSLQFLAPKLAEGETETFFYRIPIGTLSGDSANSYDTITISGRIGGYGADTVNNINLTIGSGNGLIISGIYATVNNNNYITDNSNKILVFEAYQAKAANDGKPNTNPITVYLRMYSGMAADLSITAFGATLERTSEDIGDTLAGEKLTITNKLVKTNA